MFRFPNHVQKLKAPEQPQSAGEERLLTRDIIVTSAKLCLRFSSRSKAIVFPKHVLESKSRNQLIHARKKLFSRMLV